MLSLPWVLRRCWARAYGATVGIDSPHAMLRQAQRDLDLVRLEKIELRDFRANALQIGVLGPKDFFVFKISLAELVRNSPSFLVKISTNTIFQNEMEMEEWQEQFDSFELPRVELPLVGVFLALARKT